jgi:UDP-GlcNAc:undecaprenyl-phosphate GlcNAc-1-phosphate transferase
MQPILLPALAAFVVTLLSTPVVRAVSIQAGRVDAPDRRRKLHLVATPRTGGVAIVLAYLVACGAVSKDIALGLTLVFGAGLLDDLFDLKPWHKIAAEVAGAACVYAAGLRVAAAGPAWWSFLLTVAWLVLCANALNLVDGIDGLAAGIGCIASAAAVAAGVSRGDWILAASAAPLAGCLLGFLRNNFTPASIFLGDSGSLSIGFLIGTFALRWSARAATPAEAFAPALALALPLAEVALSVLRRLVRNVPVFAGDRGHIHHRLVDRGWRPARAVVLLYAAAAGAALLALFAPRLGAALCLAAVCAGVRRLGYAEFAAAARFAREWLRPRVAAQVTVEALERSLRSAADVEDCWRAIETAGRGLGYGRVEARLGGVRFASGPSGDVQAWQMRVNLTGGDYVNVTQFPGAPECPRLLSAFVAAIRRVLPAVLERFPREAPRLAPEQYRAVTACGD